MKNILFIIMIFSVGVVKSQISLSAYDYCDNASNYIGKKVTFRAYYQDLEQAAGYKDKGLTLRSRGNTSEDIYSSYNFSFIHSDGADKFYCRMVEVPCFKVVLHIPKSLSSNLPNMNIGPVYVTGIIKSEKLVEVSSIQRVVE